MRYSRMDAATVLRYGQFDTHSYLGDVVWNGTPLTQVDWAQVPRLGDEAAASTRQEHIEVYTNIARAYRGLAQALQSQGLTDPALRYRRRQYMWERRALLARHRFGSSVFSWLLNLVSGYGDRPGRALACYLVVVSVFAAGYYTITNGFYGFITSHATALKWYEALVLSISSFHGRGFFPSVPSLGDPVAIVAAAEAIIGLFIELVFIATFTQRFFAR
jgi:transposase InsO family protein